MCWQIFAAGLPTMREIVLDTETTGFEPGEGHRIVEIGAIELFNHLPTGRTYHQYINPERGMPVGRSRFTGSDTTFWRCPERRCPAGLR
jgi:DNA polymerase-3 subunit epsilon